MSGTWQHEREQKNRSLLIFGKRKTAQYIASRPRVERVSDHALFSGADESVILSQVVKK
jgi:hypothetical protein